ncbi:MAG: uroporphyrinogen decarboxylase [Deltaproteobacteria bacterium]
MLANQAQENRTAGFSGLRVVAFESRKADEACILIKNAGGVAISAPSMREVPIEENRAAFEFADGLVAGNFDIVVFMTGVGTRHLFDAMETRYESDRLVAALSGLTVVARGPKPIRVLRELGVKISITVPEPNTWREMLTEMEQSPQGVPLKKARIAVQEYGLSNRRFLDGLNERGAEVTRVPVYRWDLPTDRRPLLAALSEIIARTADVVLFTSANQVRNVIKAANDEGMEKKLRAALEETLICSIGPVCSETLSQLSMPADFEPTRTKLGLLIRESSQCAAALLEEKRSRQKPRTVAVRPDAAAPAEAGYAGLDQSPFMKACRRQPTEFTPVWLMRQAGRYMQEYRQVRARVPFLELCKNPELSAEVAVTAAEVLGVDAAILFSDILLIVEPMGLGLSYESGEGPSIDSLIRDGSDIDRLREVDPDESLAFVFEAVKKTRAALDPSTPLIGFAGAPFTLASYIVEGGGSKNYVATKTLMYSDKGAWDAMMSLIARGVSRYLAGQVAAGVQAVQLFDSWVGCLSPDDYRRYVLPHTRAVIESLPAGIPVIHFGTGTATLLDDMATAGGSVIGVDHHTPIGPVFERLPGQAVQGNLDPVLLFAGQQPIEEACRRLLQEVGGRPGHIFNLGHGVLPGTPVENVAFLVEKVHELSAGQAR